MKKAKSGGTNKKVDSITETFVSGEQGHKIGPMIRVIREAAGISQDELADRLNTKRSAISRWENRAEDIKLSTIINIAEQSGFGLYVEARKRRGPSKPRPALAKKKAAKKAAKKSTKVTRGKKKSRR